MAAGGKLGTLITRGAVIDRSYGDDCWHLEVSPDTTVREIATLMAQFGLACELVDGSDALRLFPLGHTIAPTARELADFYQSGRPDLRQPVRFVQHRVVA